MALSLVKQIARHTVFNYVSRFVPSELILAGSYLAIWIDPVYFGRDGFYGLSVGLFIEGLFTHAQALKAGVSMLFSGIHRKFALIGMSLFYLIFVGAISFATGNIFTTLLFVWLSIKRIMASDQQSDMMEESLYSFGKIMVLILSCGIAVAIEGVHPLKTEGMDGFITRPGAVPPWGVIYFTTLFLAEILRLRSKRRKSKQNQEAFVVHQYPDRLYHTGQHRPRNGRRGTR
ncbi:MAG TPA: hypothetical protein VGD65_06760 [Chryseosolibacter sp.]